MVWPGPRLGRWPRLAAALLAVALVSVLVIAKRLDPDPRGFGTHEQLGLPACSFLQATGVRCPSCGMTTSFASVMDGRWQRAWNANPVGCLLAPVLMLLAAWLIAAAVGGRPWGFASLEMPLAAIVAGNVALSLTVWIVRLALEGGR